MKRRYILFVLICMVSFCMEIYADSKIIVNGNQVRFRSAATVNSEIYTNFDIGVELVYIETGGSGNGCIGPWYKGKFGSLEGYICSDYAILKEDNINQEDYKEYRDYLLDIGFPDSYIPYLLELHKKYPNWDFKVFNSELEFSKIVSIEYNEKGFGWSLLEDYNNSYDGYKATDALTYNYLTNVFRNNYVGGGSRWYAPNRQVIEYYLDPRNFLNQQQIFMFETLSFNEKFHTKEGITLSLKNTFMENKVIDSENNYTYEDAFYDAAKKYNVSPFLLVSRVIQEVGAAGSTIVSGTVSGYEGYYNFYNIKAYGSSNEETIRNGLEYAKSQGWDNPYKAILGGGNFLSNGYINCGQDTLYLQKWDLFGPNYGGHQYMQNIQAPASESVRTYNDYNKIGLLDSEFVFTIPVFKNMPESTILPNKGNPNNYLSSLAVNGNYLFEDATHDREFSLNLDGNTTSIEIAATKVSNKASVNGTGSIALNGEKQAVSVIVTAENGAKREYVINITRDVSVSLDISEIMRVLEFKNDGNYTYGYEVGTNIEDIINKIKEKEKKANVEYYDKDNNLLDGGIIKSGNYMKIKTDREEKIYTFIIYGDVNGDGKISAADYMLIKNHIMDVKKLSESELLYADSNRDGKVSAADYMTIKNHIMDVKKIIQ